MFKKVDAVMQKLIDGGIPGNDIIIYHNGEEVYRSYRGYSDKEGMIPMNGYEKYNIYSASKPITCVAGMQLVEKGLLELDAPLYEYIPEFRTMYIKQDGSVTPAKNAITIRHLFTMTAGFSYNLESPALNEARTATEGRCPTVETVKYLSNAFLHFEPGTKWEYGLSHDVLAAVIETVSKERFGEYVRKNIFEPLGMTHSTFMLKEEELSSLCAQYKYRAESNLYERCGNDIQHYKLGSEYESGGAGCISTVSDYIKFLEALRVGDTVLKKDSIEKMQINIFPKADHSLFWPKEQGYGYGLGVRCPNGISGRTDFGWGGAAGAYLAVDPEKNFTVYYAQHVLYSAARDGRSEILTAVIDSLK